MENENLTPVVEEPNVSQVSSESEKKSNLFKIAVIVIGILTVVGLFVNAYLMFSKKETVTKTPDSSSTVTQNPDENSSWMRYTNTTYGYSIKFPETYEVSLQTEKQKSQVGEDKSICVALKNNNTCDLAIDYLPKSIDEFTKMNMPTDGSQPQVYMVGTVKGKRIVYKIGESTTQVVIILPKPSATKEIITLSYYVPGNVETENVIDQILSTFMFVETTAPIPANWKTYVDQKYNFSFKYPSSYVVKTSNDLGGQPYDVNIYPDSKTQQARLSFKFDESKTRALADSEASGNKTDRPTEMPNITVGIHNYSTTSFNIGEGMPSGYKDCINSSAFIAYLVEVNPNLLIELDRISGSICNPDGTHNTTGTTPAELEIARQILSTFKFLD